MTRTTRPHISQAQIRVYRDFVVFVKRKSRHLIIEKRGSGMKDGKE